MTQKLKNHLISLLGKTEANRIIQSLKSGKTIIVKGPSGPTGKTTLTELLKKEGYQAVEEHETAEVILNQPIPKAR